MALTPNRVRSFYAPDEVLFSKAPVALAGGAGAVAALSSPDTAQAAPAGIGDPMTASPFGFGPSAEDLARALAQLQAGMPAGFSGAPSVGLPPQAGGPMAVRPFGFGASPMPVTASAGDLAVPQAANEADVQRLKQAMGMVPPGDAPAPAARAPLSFGAPQRAVAPAGSMTAPLPPQRPAELQAAQADMPALGAQPIAAQGVGTPGSGDPSMMDRFLTGLGRPDVSDLLINIGSGLMTTKGFGPAIAAGVQANQAQEGKRAATDLARAEYGLKIRKLAQEAGGLNQTRSFLIAAGNDAATVDGAIAASQAGRAEALSNLLNNASPKKPEAPFGWQANAGGGSVSYVEGGPHDPRVKEAEAAATARGTASAKGPDDFSLSPGQVRYNGAGQPIASARSDKPENFDTESKLRAEFSKGLGTFGDVHDGYGRVIAATQERERNPTAVSPASDMSLVFGFMKMLDPTSVVREGEYATAKNAAGIPDQFRNAYNKAVDGEFLTPQQRQDFVNQSAALYGKARSNAEGVAERYRGLAGQYGVDPGRSVYLPEMPKPPRVSGGRTGGQGGGLDVGGTRDMGDGITVRRVR